ncbi:MAG: amidohydrolase [Myxococcales bacterium]|nr:amidohydrolase [Myxococcales bacterium]
MAEEPGGAAPAEAPTYMLERRLEALNDEEGERLPTSLPRVIDAHVHLFPDRLFDAIWRWFDAYGWPIRYRLYTDRVVEFLRRRGVDRIVGLHYAHKPGIAASMNRYMADVVARHPEVLGAATVFPGEEDAGGILERAFASGLRAVKMHCHVQSFAPDDPALHEVYATCAAHDVPLVIHAGREPRSPAYKVDTYALCAVDRIEHVLKDYPTLRLVVPHLGADEYDGYARLLGRYDNLWLDTTMTVAGYLPGSDPRWVLRVRPGRVLYGTDFPNLPYAWDREVRRLRALALPEEELELLLGRAAAELFGL